MKFKKSVWSGDTIVTSLVTRQQIESTERLSIVHGFDDDGWMQPSFKAAYIVNGHVSMTLQFSRAIKSKAPIWSDQNAPTGPFELEGTMNLNPLGSGDPAVGDLSSPYTTNTSGTIALWNFDNNDEPYKSWEYRDYWGLAVLPTFDPPLPQVSENPLGKYRVNGRGHTTPKTFNRVFTYSLEGEELYLKSSILELETSVFCDRPFESFLPD